MQYEEFRNVKRLGEQIRHKAMIYEHPNDVSIYYSLIDNHVSVLSFNLNVSKNITGVVLTFSLSITCSEKYRSLLLSSHHTTPLITIFFISEVPRGKITLSCH